MWDKSRYIPLVRNAKIRMAEGFVLLILSIILAESISNKGHVEIVIVISIVAWVISVFLTDKYVHKYPQRYFTYLAASHMKAAIVMASLLYLMSIFFSSSSVPNKALWCSFIYFVLVDALVSIPYRREIPTKQPSVACSSPVMENVGEDQPVPCNTALSSIDTKTILERINTELEKPFVEFMESNLPSMQGGNENVFIVDDVEPSDGASGLMMSTGLTGFSCIVLRILLWVAILLSDICRLRLL
jgi:hypothetical protein